MMEPQTVGSSIAEDIREALPQLLERLETRLTAVVIASRKSMLSTHEVELVYGLNAGTLRNKRSKGEGPPYVKDGGTILYPRKHLEEYLERRLRRTAG